MSGYWTGILGILCINVVFAYSVYLPAAAGQLNLGGAGFMAIGAYVAAYGATTLDQPLWITIPAAAVVTGLIGFLIAFPILRTRGVYMVLATFAFAEIVAGVIINVKAIGGPAGFEVATFASLPVLASVAAACVALVFYLMSTRLGLAIRAVHDDENVANLFGVDVRSTQVATFAIGGVLAGIAGALYAHQYNYVEIQVFNILLSVYVLLYVLIGGTQTPYGPLFGAIVFTLLPEAMRGSDSWRFVVFGAFLVAMMMFRPEGAITRTMIDRIVPARRAAARKHLPERRHAG
jgi:branched-chain amino acid transport system permease protein